MYNDFKVANYSKALLSPELYARHLSRLFSGEVVDGLTVTPGTGLQVVLAPGNAIVRYGAAAVASARLVSLVANFNLSIGTPDTSNPRIDLVVLYVDNAVSLPTGTPTSANLDGLGVAKAKIVAGTPGATPVVANATAIQESVGAGNPYIVIAQVRVDVGVSVIAANKISDSRTVALPAAISGEWISWTPTFSNGITVGNSVVVAKYKQIGKTVFVRLKFSLGSTGSVANQPVFTLPVAANADYAAGNYALSPLYVEDFGVAGYIGYSKLNNATVAELGLTRTDGVVATPTSLSAVFTWSTNDFFVANFSYEAA